MTTYVTNAQLGLKDLTGLTFDPDASFTGCLICGEVYQSHLDRKCRKLRDEPLNPLNEFFEEYMYFTKELRRGWDVDHAKLHTQREHEALRASGMFCTPEAALKLTPLGVFSIDHHNETELAAAMTEAPRAPQNDVQH